MKSQINIQERKPIWIALSDFYVDTEFEEADFKYIASVIKESPYTVAEIKKIDKEEVFPVLHSNLIAVAGNWTGFQEEWLASEIAKRIYKRTFFGKAINTLKYWLLKWMYKGYWEKLEEQIDVADRKA